MKKLFTYKLLITTILSISLLSSFVYGDKIQSSEPIIIHENPDQIQNIIISDDEIQSLISNIEDEEKRAILYEISITPVKEEVRLYNEDADLNYIGFISEDPIKEYKKLAQLSIAELRKN